MVQSSEYPDLLFVSPRWWSRGRRHEVQIIVVHHTAGAERSTSAEDGAAYDQRREERTSTHYFHDSNSTVQCVLTKDTAFAAFSEGNARGIHHELCGTLQTRAQWLDPASDGTLWQAARQIAKDCRKYGIPARRLTPAQMRAGERGICGHGDVTAAWGLGDHTDPGPHFPWDVLLARVTQFLAGPGRPTESMEEDMLILAQVTGLPAVWKGNGVDCTGVRTEDAVRQLIAAGAYNRHTSGYYGGSAPFASLQSMFDVIGTPVGDPPDLVVTDAQIDRIADRIAAQMINDDDNLSTGDLDAVREQVKAALGTGMGGVLTPMPRSAGA